MLRGLVTPVRNNALDLTCLFLGHTGAQGVAGTLFARAMGGALVSLIAVCWQALPALVH